MLGYRGKVRSKLKYNERQKKQANTFFALGFSEYEAARVLIENKIHREAISHLYYCSFYLTQSLLADRLRRNVSHASVERKFHECYGKDPSFPKTYVRLHSRLHRLRTIYSYKATITPPKIEVANLFRALSKYVSYCMREIPKITYQDLLSDLISSNDEIKDLSFDYYCPKTYSHHTRFTVWLRPSYNRLLTPPKIAAALCRLIGQLRVRKKENYVLGLNSKVNQYSDDHLILLDFDSFDSDVEAELLKVGGVLMTTARGFHFISNSVLHGRRNWEKVMRGFLKNRSLKNKIDVEHIEISLKRGYATLRITSSPVKSARPIFFKELWKA